MSHKTRIMYMELKTGYQNDGPARIGQVTFSKSGKAIYYKDKVFRRTGGQGILGNYMLDSRDPNRIGPDPWPPVMEFLEYWISGPKKNGRDRLFGTAPVEIDEDVAAEYWEKIRGVKRQSKENCVR